MKQNYNYCLTQVLKSEGGYTNDPKDHGGPTNYGITIADYRAYINKSGTASDVKNMHLADAQSIYRTKYWNALGCDDLPSGVDYTVFDYGVNSGISRANSVYKRLALKYPNAGGTYDEAPVDLINAINDERLAYMKSLKTWPHFGAGWGTRVARVRADSIKLATGTNTPVHSTAVTGGVIALAAAHHWYDYWPYILGGSVAAIALMYLGYYLYNRKS
jgi:lysozyme family protein